MPEPEVGQIWSWNENGERLQIVDADKCIVEFVWLDGDMSELPGEVWDMDEFLEEHEYVGGRSCR